MQEASRVNSVTFSRIVSVGSKRLSSNATAIAGDFSAKTEHVAREEHAAVNGRGEFVVRQ